MYCSRATASEGRESSSRYKKEGSGRPPTQFAPNRLGVLCARQTTARSFHLEERRHFFWARFLAKCPSFRGPYPQTRPGTKRAQTISDFLRMFKSAFLLLPGLKGSSLFFSLSLPGIYLLSATQQHRRRQEHQPQSKMRRKWIGFIGPLSLLLSLCLDLGECGWPSAFNKLIYVGETLSGNRLRYVHGEPVKSALPRFGAGPISAEESCHSPCAQASKETRQGKARVNGEPASGKVMLPERLGRSQNVTEPGQAHALTSNRCSKLREKRV